jgi:polyphosphate kinase
MNRELWLQFNRRVMEEASIAATRCWSSCASCRSPPTISTNSSWSASPACARLKAGVVTRSQDGLTPAGQLVAIGEGGRGPDRRPAGALGGAAHDLHENGIHLLQPGDIGAGPDLAGGSFLNYIFPVLTPLAIDPAHPFPSSPISASPSRWRWAQA